MFRLAQNAMAPCSTKAIDFLVNGCSQSARVNPGSKIQTVAALDWVRTLNLITRLHVRYGIEQYYVQEGTGGQVERPRGGEQVAIRVAIDTRGKAGILAVLFDGQERYRETLF